VGIPTNIEFLKRCCENGQFADGGVTTKFIEENKETLLAETKTPTRTVALAALSVLRAGAGLGKEFSFHVNGSSKAVIPLRIGGAHFPVSITHVTPCEFIVEGSGFRHVVKPCPALVEGHTAAHVDNDERIEYRAVVLDHQVAVLLPTGTEIIAREPLAEGFGDIKYVAGGASRVLSPMPGKVSKLLVADGTPVKRGDNILIVEAMKMEHLVKAPKDGVVRFSVKEGTMAGADQPLAAIEEEH
jgi:3-methylcrotonyl-CoA carboxylase alpha subunit